MKSYDVIIAGASFAGLAVASELNGEVLLLDKKEIGTEQTSACGTFYNVIEELNCEDSILQTFDRLVFHCPAEVEVKLIEPLCTIDYEKFCQTLAKRVEAEKIKTAVKGVKSNMVLTNSEEFQSNCIVDCTGWRAILASSLRKRFVNKKRLAFGLETVVGYRDDGYHLYIDPKIVEQGVGWVFPIGNKSRMGVASYTGKTNLMSELRRFVNNFDSEMGPVHGGYIPYGLRDPVVKNIFLVGDSAGQTLPFTAEGIRKCMFFGRKCGQLIQKIIEGKIALSHGLKEYELFVEKSRKDYDRLLWLQYKFAEAIRGKPSVKVKLATKIVGNRILSKFFQRKYLNL